MEEYTQITLNEWTSWKEDIRQKLAETAGNFVYIGYRLKQIRDSGMYGGAADIFGFAKKEYGLEKSTVSRFIAINERFSENGNSLELKEEYKMFGSSKLAEMLTLTDSECEMIVEQTTVKEIRELKHFCTTNETLSPEEINPTYSPLQKCIIDYFSDPVRKNALNETMRILAEEPSEENQKKAAALINPGDYITHKKGIVFMFLYDYQTGVKYKLMTQPEPVSISWIQFFAEIIDIYQAYAYREEGVWNAFYGVAEKEEIEEEENATFTQENQGFSESVATSQQEQKQEQKERKKPDKTEAESSERSEQNTSVEETEEESETNSEEPDNREEEQEEVITPPERKLMDESSELTDYLCAIADKDDSIPSIDELKIAKEKAERLAAVIEQLILIQEEKENE